MSWSLIFLIVTTIMALAFVAAIVWDAHENGDRED